MLTRRVGRTVSSPAARALEREASAIAARATSGPQARSGQVPTGARLPHLLADRLGAVAPYDFRHVRVQDGPDARTAAARLGSAAFTVGRDIHLGDPSARGVQSHDEVLAHEAIHAAQQRALPRRPGSALREVGRSQPGAPQGLPGVNADESWRELVTESFVPDQAPIRTRGNDARERFLRAGEGQRVINSLWHLSRDQAKTPRFGVNVAFRTALPPQAQGLDASGFFEPDVPDARRYFVHVKDVVPSSFPGSITLGSTSGEGVYSTHSDPESDIAATLHHELEHVEFVRAGLGTIWPTGHGDVSKGQVEPLFRQRIADFAHDIDGIEARLHADTDAKKQTAPPPSTTSLADPKETGAPNANPSGPPFVGGRLSAEGGIAGQGGPRFGGVVGADLLLGRISALSLGPRGIYLSPDRLLAGGAVGLHAVQSGENRPGEGVENPLFFDLEAGVVGQLNTGESSKIMDRAALFGSLSVGQEYGTSGSRFFWKVGGYVIVSDRKETSGGLNAGIGVRFP